MTKTAPGHATILSGVHANVHGIVANDWLDRTTFLQGNNVEDVDAPLVGLPPRLDRYAYATFAAKAGRSPRNFLGVTVGDRLKAKYGAAAKVFGVADKDRASILMSGPKADGAYWTEEGRFVTSTYYRCELAGLARAVQRGAAAPPHHFGADVGPAGSTRRSTTASKAPTTLPANRPKTACRSRFRRKWTAANRGSRRSSSTRLTTRSGDNERIGGGRWRSA